MQDDSKPSSGDPTLSQAGRAPDLILESGTLFTGGRKEISIRHNGRIYRLRCTRLGKLILTA